MARHLLVFFLLAGCDDVPPLDFEAGTSSEAGAEGGCTNLPMGASCCNGLPCFGALCCGQCGAGKCASGEICCGTTGTIVCKKVGMTCN